MKIAIIKLSSLGDIVHAMVILQYIKKYNQNIDIDWIVEEAYKDLLVNHPDINKLHIVNIKKAKKEKSFFLFIKELKRVRSFGEYDMVIDLQGLLKSALIAKLIPSRVTLGYDKTSAREGLAAIFYNKKFNIPYEQNIIERNISLIAKIFKFCYDKESIQNKKPFLYSSKKFKFNILSNTQKNIVLIPGASFDSKAYPSEKLAEVTTKIKANFIIIWGNKKEKNLANRIKFLAPNVNLSDELSLDLLLSLIIQVDLVIGPDTGPTHLAWALNVPSITLFGPTPGYRNSFITDMNKTIESDSKVNPFKINKEDYSINDINVEDISEVAEGLLKLTSE